jgi:hypothetical protein
VGRNVLGEGYDDSIDAEGSTMKVHFRFSGVLINKERVPNDHALREHAQYEEFLTDLNGGSLFWVRKFKVEQDVAVDLELSGIVPKSDGAGAVDKSGPGVLAMLEQKGGVDKTKVGA